MSDSPRPADASADFDSGRDSAERHSELGELTEQLVKVLDECLNQVHRGERVDRERLFEEHPELADRLPGYLDSIEALHTPAPQHSASHKEARPGDRHPTHPQSTMDEASPPSLDVLRKLGDYRLLREVGRGGMGVVYEARQLSLDRRVALKVLPLAAVLDPQHLQRFRVEARAAAGLHHTHIVPVYATGSAEGMHFYAMQYIEGCTLAQLISCMSSERQSEPTDDRTQVLEASSPSQRTQRLPEPLHSSASRLAETLDRKRFRWTATVIAPIAEALDYAHDQGITHRDVKPSNILLDVAGRPYLADFGLARIETELTITRPGDLVGTLSYMSPERFGAKSNVVDHRSDIYSLGVTLYEMLTLQKPFGTDGGAALRVAILAGDVGPPRRVDPRIPAALEVITLKAMAHRPEERYQTSAALAEDLHRYLDDRPILARRPTIVQRISRWAYRRRRLVMFAALMLAVLSVVALFSAWQIDQARRRAVDGEARATAVLHRERQFKDDAYALQDRAEQAERRAERELWKALRAQARASLGSHRVGQRFDTLAAVREAAALRDKLTLTEDDLRDLRSDAVAALSLVDVKQERVWDRLTPSSTIESVDFTSDLQEYVQQDGSVMSVRRTSDDHELARLPLTTFPLASRFAPDGTHLAIVIESPAGPRVELWNWVTGRLLFSHGADTLGATVTRYSTAFRPHHAEMAVGSADHVVHRLNLVDGEIIESIPMQWRPHVIRYSPDGRYLAVNAVKERQISIRDLTAEGEVSTCVTTENTYTIAWQPDGNILAVGSGFDIGLWDMPRTDGRTSGGVPGRLLSGGNSTVGAIEFHPTSKLLFSAGYNGPTRLWDVSTGEIVLAVDGHARTFDQTGERLSFRGAGTIGVWQVGGDEHLWRVPVAPPGRIEPRSLAWIANGRVLLCGGEQGLEAWDVPRRKFLGYIDVPDVYGLVGRAHAKDVLLATDDGLLQMPVVIHRSATEIAIRLDRPRRFAPTSPSEHGVMSVAVGGETSEVIALSEIEPGQTRLILPESEKRVMLPQNEKSPHDYLAVSHDGRWVAIAHRHQPGLHLVDVSNNTTEKRLTLRDGPLRFSPDGDMLAMCSAERIEIWHGPKWDHGPTISRSESMQVGDVSFSQNSKLLAATGTSGRILICNPRRGQILAELRVPDDYSRVKSLAFDPSGRRLAVACHSGGLRIWEVATITEELKKMGLAWDVDRRPSPIDPSPIDPSPIDPVEIDPVQLDLSDHLPIKLVLPADKPD